MAPVNLQCFPLDTCRFMMRPSVGKYWPCVITMTILSVFVNLHFMPFHDTVYPNVIPSLVTTKDIHAISFLLFTQGSFTLDESESERELFFEIKKLNESHLGVVLLSLSRQCK